MLTDDYITRFGGIGRLYGLTSLQAFSKAHIIIIGLGGVGSWTAEALARSGIGELTLIDLDDICITNTNRQLHAHNGAYGKMKAQALTERLHSIHPTCRIHPELTFYSEKNADTLLSTQPDLVIDAIDSIKAKCHLLAECKKRNLSVFSCGGAGGKMDASQVKIADLSRTTGDKLASSVRSRLRKEYGFPSGEEKKPRKFGIPTVYSPEEMTPPQPCQPSPLQDGTPFPPLAHQDSKHQKELPTQEKTLPSSTAPRNLNCATGYGAVSHVTATFGFLLAQLALDHLKTQTNMGNKNSTS